MKAVIIEYKIPLVAILKTDSEKQAMVMLGKGLKSISEAVLKDTSLENLGCEIVKTQEIEIPDDAKTEDIKIVDDTIEIKENNE